MANCGKSYWTIDRVMWLVIGCAVAALLFWLMRRLSDVLLPFFAACLIAYLLNPIVEMFQRLLHLKKRLLPVILTLALVAGVLTGLGYLCAPMIVAQMNSVSELIKYYAQHFDKLPFIPSEWRNYIQYFDVDQITRYLSPKHIESFLTKGASLLTQSVESIMHMIEWALMFIYNIFILIDYEQIARGIKLIFPEKIRPQATSILGDVERAMNSYFRGQGLVALCACILYCVGFTIIGLPLSIVMGLLVGVLYMIPYFQYITLIPVTLLCFIGSLSGDFGFWSEIGKSVMVYVVVQCVCDYVITPHVMGKEMGLNPTMILLSLSIWGSLLGIMGMIIALPATALIMSYYERYISNHKSASQKAAEAALAASAEAGENVSES